jgi:hypothetical protein
MFFCPGDESIEANYFAVAKFPTVTLQMIVLSCTVLALLAVSAPLMILPD